MARPCSDGCGKEVDHWAQECFPVAPWDDPTLPPKGLHERCRRHPVKAGSLLGGCAFRDDEPGYCAQCHLPTRKCDGHHKKNGQVVLF